jgi:hypothetical protein
VNVFAGRTPNCQPQPWAIMVKLCLPYRSGTGAEQLVDSDAGHYAPSHGNRVGPQQS